MTRATDDPPAPGTGPSPLDRTRSAVVNVLMLDALAIASSGALLRWRMGHSGGAPRTGLGNELHATLGVLLVAGFVALRRGSPIGTSRVVAALVGAGALPLGLAYGWFVEPSLGAVAPFWVSALALAALAFPRAGTDA